jgi:hypothetical protein
LIICGGTVISLGSVETLKFGSASGCFSPLQPPNAKHMEHTTNTANVRNIVRLPFICRDLLNPHTGGASLPLQAGDVHTASFSCPS